MGRTLIKTLLILLYSFNRVVTTLWLKMLGSLQIDFYWYREVTLACPFVSFLLLHAWYTVVFNKCNSVASWQAVIMFEACQQSNFFSLSSALFLNLVVIKGVRFLSETIEKGSLEHQCSTWKTCWPLGGKTASLSWSHPTCGHIISA